ncbi:MAG: hypothetical protein EYC68_02590 [Chloroflexota bacterium]|nr:MAG: hypothetical protein EYC68_02590 [Chloroflexota bacterium]
MEQENPTQPIQETMPQSELPQPTTVNPPAPAKRSRKRLVIVVGALVLAILISIPICQFFAGFLGSFPEEMKNTSQVIDEYLTAMARKDVNGAYQLLSDKAKTQTPLNQVETLVTGNNYFIFSDYREHSFTGFEMTQVGVDKLAEITGNVEYEGNFVGEYSAVLVKENGVWKIQAIYVNAPAEKIGK